MGPAAHGTRIPARPGKEAPPAACRVPGIAPSATPLPAARRIMDPLCDVTVCHLPCKKQRRRAAASLAPCSLNISPYVKWRKGTIPYTRQAPPPLLYPPVCPCCAGLPKNHTFCLLLPFLFNCFNYAYAFYKNR